MSPKRRSKTKVKFNKLTEEQKQKLLDKRAAVEEEQCRKREELLNIFLKIKLSKEEAITRTNTHKLNDRWRQMLREIKSLDLQREIAFLREKFESQLDTKGSIIVELLDEMTNTEEQRSIAARTHVQTLQTMIDQQLLRLHQEQDAFNRQLQTMREHWKSQMNRLENLQRDDQEGLADILHSAEVKAGLDEMGTEVQYRKSSMDVKSQNCEDRRCLSMFLEGAMVQQWTAFTSYFIAYRQKTGDMQRNYSDASAEVLESERMISTASERIYQMQESIEATQRRLAAEMNAHERSAAALREDLQRLQHSVTAVRGEAAGCRKQHHTSLRQLTTTATAVTQKLAVRRKMLDKMVMQYELCSGLESDELLLACQQTDGSLASGEAESEAEPTVHMGPVEQTVCRIYRLEPFWRRYSAVLLDINSMNLLEVNLRLQSRQLKDSVADYMSALCVSTHRRPNALQPQTRSCNIVEVRGSDFGRRVQYRTVDEPRRPTAVAAETYVTSSVAAETYVTSPVAAETHVMSSVNRF